MNGRRLGRATGAGLVLTGALLVAGALLATGRAAPVPEADTSKEDEKTLRAANLGTDEPALLDFFRRRTLADADRKRIEALVARLGDDSYEVREKAAADLVALGPSATPLLHQATRSDDIEVVRRAEKCLQQIEKTSGTVVTAAAARLLAVRKPAGAAEALFAFLPFADDDVAADAVRDALAALALRDGKPDRAVVEALEDKAPVRRAAAAAALIRAQPAAERKALHRFLHDPDASVRLQAALAFLDTRDAEALPVLIELLGDLPLERCWSVEDTLCRIAGEQAPAVSLGTDEAARKKCRDAWKEWWARNGQRLDLARLDLTQRLLGFTLVVEMNRGLAGRVLELGADGKPRWEIAGLQYPVDAQVVGTDRVLIAEYRSRRVTERNFKGEVQWEKTVNGLIQGVQRLANGNTFLVTRNQLLEVDRDGKEVSSHTRPGHDIMAAQRLRDGTTVLVTLNGQCVRLDASGAEVKSFPVNMTYVIGSNIDVLPNGRVVIPQYGNNKVVEFDTEGKPVWEATVTNPSTVLRLPNGNTLVGSMVTQRVVELDRSGKEVWEYKSEGRVMRVRRR
jgi:hypothetical protein